MKKLDKIRGCMFGLAVGDAVGYPVEFKDSSSINRSKVLSIGENGKVMYYSDDTQMSLATAKGLLNSWVNNDAVNLENYTDNIYLEYLNWLATQADPLQSRAPGMSCISALRSGKMGTFALPINDSKGCGGVMRTAPVGLVFRGLRAFELGARVAAITHGHATGYITAGFLSETIGGLLDGDSLEDVLKIGIKRLFEHHGYKETQAKLRYAVSLAQNTDSDLVNIEKIGEGWIAEEALAISIYCAIRHEENFEDAIASAVCHSGDSDSTGSITGAIVGTILGYDAIPERWRERIENKGVIEAISLKLLDLRGA